MAKKGKVVKQKRIFAKKRTKSIVKKGSFSKMRLPVISAPDALPLLDPNFTWEKFERFTKQLIKLIHSDHEVSLFGVKGQKQYGIDLVAQDKSGRHFFVQNKKYKTYSVAKFRKAKAELKLKGKTILLLACEASSDLRLEVLGDPLWEIWDVNDISDKVFQLANDSRKGLVKKYFGLEWAKAFSEFNEFSSVVPPIDFFRSYFDSKKLFNHMVPFLGRDQELKELKKFVSGNHQALVLNAAGGVGKSRLLWEFAKNNTDLGWAFLFIKEGIRPQADHFQNIKSEKVIFIFDDAHRFDTAPYLAFIYNLKNIKYKIVFSTRPQGRERLKLELVKNNLESEEIQDFEIKRFTAKDAKLLVSKLLPQIETSHVWPIANLFTDSTLVGVLACNLIKKKSVSLASLSAEEDIKGRIIASFTDELSGKIASKLNIDFIQKILNYISGLAPIFYDEKRIDPQFISATGEKESDVNECIADLLYSGVLVERGGRVRISPDVLSDCILEAACYLKDDSPSDYFKDLFEKVDGKLRSNLLKNISELDWRKKKAELTSSTLLSNFWKKFKDTSRDDLAKLENKLEILKSIAYYQPIESYESLLSATSTLSKVSHDNRDYRFNSCINSIVEICRDIILAGYKVEELMMTMWNLGKGDFRNLNPHPEHPIRRLSDLCTYERNFPITLYERTLRGLKAIIDVYDSENDHHDPISMLGGFLAKTASTTYSEGYTLTISPFHISYENTKKIRIEVFRILKKLALSKDLKASYLAVKEISDAANPPHGMVGMEITKKQARIWHEEISEAINLLIEIYNKTSHSLIKVHVKNSLNHKIRWNKRSHHKSVISSFFKKNPFTIEELKYVPFAFWSYNDLLVRRDFKDYKKTQAEEQKIYEKITKEIVSNLKTPIKILKYTEDVVTELLIVNDSIHSWRFSCVLSESIDNRQMCDALLLNNSNKIEHDFGVFLKKVSLQDRELALEYAEKALSLGNSSIIKSIANSFWWVFEGSESEPSTVFSFRKFFNHQDEDVRLSSLNSIRILVNQSHQGEAVEYIVSFDITSKRSAESLFDLVNPYCIKFDELTDTQLSLLLTKIKDIEDLSDHGIGEFVAACANRIPLELFEILLYRVESKREHEGNFTALPYLGFGKLNLHLPDDDMIKVFEKIAEALKKDDGDTFWLPNLFYDVAKGRYDLAVNYVTSLLKSDDIETVGVGSELLRKFNSSIVFSRQDWVRDLLIHGKAKGHQFFDEIKGCLFRLGIPMEKHGTAGQPMPQDVALVENSIAAVGKAESDLEKEFYTQLKEYGEREIARTMKEHQRYLDE